ncbi:unnamed protein product [Symbiodinium microadriaticum]|nr:unnamed protein product [Symbiodinium microadriaticum]
MAPTHRILLTVDTWWNCRRSKITKYTHSLDTGNCEPPWDERLASSKDGKKTSGPSVAETEKFQEQLQKSFVKVRMQFEKDTERLEEETAQHCEAQKEVFTQLQAAIANTRDQVPVDISDEWRQLQASCEQEPDEMMAEGLAARLGRQLQATSWSSPDDPTTHDQLGPNHAEGDAALSYRGGQTSQHALAGRFMEQAFNMAIHSAMLQTDDEDDLISKLHGQQKKGAVMGATLTVASVLLLLWGNGNWAQPWRLAAVYFESKIADMGRPWSWTPGHLEDGDLGFYFFLNQDTGMTDGDDGGEGHLTTGMTSVQGNATTPWAFEGVKMETKILTLNAQSLSGKRRNYEDQLGQLGCNIPYFQETTGQFGVCGRRLLRLATDSAKHWGTAVWISKTRGVMLREGKPCVVQEEDVLVVREPPRLRILAINATLQGGDHSSTLGARREVALARDLRSTRVSQAAWPIEIHTKMANIWPHVRKMLGCGSRPPPAGGYHCARTTEPNIALTTLDPNKNRMAAILDLSGPSWRQGDTSDQDVQSLAQKHVILYDLVAGAVQWITDKIKKRIHQESRPAYSNWPMRRVRKVVIPAQSQAAGIGGRQARPVSRPLPELKDAAGNQVGMLQTEQKWLHQLRRDVEWLTSDPGKCPRWGSTLAGVAPFVGACSQVLV